MVQKHEHDTSLFYTGSITGLPPKLTCEPLQRLTSLSVSAFSQRRRNTASKGRKDAASMACVEIYAILIHGTAQTNQHKYHMRGIRLDSNQCG
jgi:hypothetical protein